MSVALFASDIILSSVLTPTLIFTCCLPVPLIWSSPYPVAPKTLEATTQGSGMLGGIDQGMWPLSPVSHVAYCPLSNFLNTTFLRASLRHSSEGEFLCRCFKWLMPCPVGRMSGSRGRSGLESSREVLATSMPESAESSFAGSLSSLPDKKKHLNGFLSVNGHIFRYILAKSGFAEWIAAIRACTGALRLAVEQWLWIYGDPAIEHGVLNDAYLTQPIPCLAHCRNIATTKI